jgi:ABC-type transport system involved in multi-copper enzyme maturation permease subunit
MNALLKAELLKLRTTRTFAVVVGVSALFSMMLAVLGATVEKNITAHELFTNNSITYVIVLLGAIGMTGEWRHRTITSTILASPDRVRLLSAKVMASAAAGVVLVFLVTVVTMIAGTIALKAGGHPTLGIGGLADVLWRNLAVAAVLGPLGVCIGALGRNQIVTVVVLIAVAAVLEPQLFAASHAVGQFGPLAEAPGAVLGGSSAATEGMLAAGPALAVLIAWTAAAFGAAAIRLRNRDLV